VPSRFVYDLLYRTGAARARRGWDSGVAPELQRLVEGDGLDPGRPGGGRALDLGCGSGGNVVYLAGRGFDATGVDFSPTAIAQARRAAQDAGVDARFLVGDVTKPVSGLEPPFDLVLLYNVLQDVSEGSRPGLAAETTRLTRPGGAVLLWCWYGRKADLPLISYRGPSRIAPFVIEPGDEEHLFGAGFDIERVETDAGPLRAAFLLTRR
jgi:SAM-dependent methyltransferase